MNFSTVRSIEYEIAEIFSNSTKTIGTEFAQITIENK